jgi:DNA-binding NarL/FixJ family response regulator
MHALQTYVVEDSLVLRDSLIGTLEELAPLRVVGTAEDEASAVSWLTQPGNHADLLIVDIFLKGGSGLGVLRSASRLSPLSHVVVMSNYASQDLRRKCLELGADQVFDKSGEIDALIQYCAGLAPGISGSPDPSGGRPAGVNVPDPVPQDAAGVERRARCLR